MFSHRCLVSERLEDEPDRRLSSLTGENAGKPRVLPSTDHTSSHQNQCNKAERALDGSKNDVLLWEVKACLKRQKYRKRMTSIPSATRKQSGLYAEGGDIHER